MVSTADVFSEGVGTGSWEDLFNHRNSTPARHSFVFFSLVIFVRTMTFIKDSSFSKNFSQLFLNVTFREAIPDLQPVIATEHSSWRVWVLLQVKTFKLQDNLSHLRRKDDVGALQAVGVLFREPRGLYHSTGSCIVLRTFGTCEQEAKGTQWECLSCARGTGRRQRVSRKRPPSSLPWLPVHCSAIP